MFGLLGLARPPLRTQIDQVYQVKINHGRAVRAKVKTIILFTRSSRLGEQAEQGEQKSQMPKNAQQEGFEVVE